MATHIFEVGRIDLDSRVIVLTPQQEQVCADANAVGEMDFDDGKPCEPLHHYSDLACVEEYIVGWRNAQHSAELAKHHVPDWQAFVEHAAKAEAQDGSIEDDHDWIRHGC